MIDGWLLAHSFGRWRGAVCVHVNSYTGTIHSTNMQGSGSINMWKSCGSYSCVEGALTCGSY